jgi:hypothetical protein
MPDWQKAAELRLLREITFYYMLCNSEGRGMNVADLLKSLRPHLPQHILQQLDAWEKNGLFLAVLMAPGRPADVASAQLA